MFRRAGLLLLLISVAALTGCSKGTSPAASSGTTAEEQQVQMSIADAPEVVNDGLYESEEPAGFRLHGGGGALTGEPESNPPPDPGGAGVSDRHYWRTITNVDRSYDIELSNPDANGRPRSAHVVLHKRLTGHFNVVYAEIVQGSQGQDSIIPHRSTKPLHDHWVRHLWLVRTPPSEGGPSHREWHLVAASGVEVTSPGGEEAAQTHIQSIRLQVGEQDTTFADPAAAITWHQLWRAPAGTEATITVTTNHPDDFVVLMHRDLRLRLVANGDNTYSGTWTTPVMGGLKHFGVNALAHATLYDDEGEYHSHACLYPYLNQGEVMAETLP